MSNHAHSRTHACSCTHVHRHTHALEFEQSIDVQELVLIAAADVILNEPVFFWQIGLLQLESHLQHKLTLHTTTLTYTHTHTHTHTHVHAHTQKP